MTEATSTDRFGSMPHVGRNVRALRLHRGMTLDHLAARAGVTPQAVGLIDARVASGLPTIVTSNFSLGELRDRWGGMPGMRIASRLGGACERIQMGGVDRRLS